MSDDVEIAVYGPEVDPAELESVYRAAFGAPGYDEPPEAARRFVAEQLPLHAQRDGFRCVVARGAGRVMGFAYGYTGQRGQWWSDHVAERVAAGLADEWVGGHFEFVELAVDPAEQGRGVGQALATALLSGVGHDRALLSTFNDDRPAVRLYRRLGWTRLSALDADSDLYGLRLDPKGLVERGYDALSYRYRGDDDDPVEYAPWMDTLIDRLPPAAAVLDIGCGCGVPVARRLAAAGFAVTGIDISRVQIERARSLVPDASFVQTDAAHAAFDPAGFDAVVCLYALIHMPQPEQVELLTRVATWLRPGGWLLVTTGATAWTGTERGWLDGDAPMWWSHPDAATYRRWITEAGLEVIEEGFVPEGSSGHQVFWARKGNRGGSPPS